MQGERCGNRVRELREDRLMTREELAEKSGLSVRTVWSVENGYPCRLVTRRRILNALGVSRKKHALVFPDSATVSRDEGEAVTTDESIA